MFSPHHHIVTIGKKYADEIEFGSLKLYLDPSYQPEWHATIKGRVVGSPNLQPGDEILFNYLVVFDRDFITDPEKFIDLSDGNPFEFQYADGYKRRIRVTVMDRQTTAAVLLDPFGELLDGCYGPRATVEKWLSGFKFHTTDDIYYCNMFLADKEYWKVKNFQVYARRRGDTWEMLNDYVMLEAQEQEIQNSILVIPEHLKRKVDRSRARVVNITENDEIKPGEMVYIDYARCEKYEIDGKNYLITTRKKILGK